MAASHSTRIEQGKPSPSNGSAGQGHNNILSVPSVPQTTLGVSQNPNTVYQQIHEVSSKRISTLDYLRKV